MASGSGRTPRVLLITHPTPGAQGFAQLLVERGLIACANRIAVQSVYRWQGAIESGPEVLLICKTTADLVPAIERLLAEHHPYDVAECITLEPASVEPRYLEWLLAETGRGPGGDG